MTNTKPLPKQAPVSSMITELLPIVNITDFNAFTDKNGGIVELMQINTRDLFSAKVEDVEYDMGCWSLLLKTYMNDLKIIYMGYPVEVTSQVAYIEKRLSKTKNPIFRKELEGEKQELIQAHKENLAKEFYLMIFSKDQKEYNSNMNRIYAILGRAGIINFLPLPKKIQILSKMQNMNLPLTAIPKTKNIPRTVTGKDNFNSYLVSTIQPQGNISFRDERFIRTGYGYEACVRIFGTPSEIKFGWISNFITNYENTIVTFDIGASERNKTLKNISTSLEEQQNRFDSARNSTERQEARNNYMKLDMIQEQVIEAGEVIKQVHIRIFCYEKTENELEKSTTDIINDLVANRFKASIFLDEGKYDWLSLFTSLNEQSGMPNHRQGLPIPTEAFTLGHPYHFSSLSDPFGTYYGKTQTGGTVCFDPYQKDKMRTFYSMIILGVLGTGKSTLLKDMIKKDVILGNYVRGFSTNKEFDKLIRYLGGSIINLDGSEGFINILHIYRTGDMPISINANSKHLSEEERAREEKNRLIAFELSCYRKHIQKVVQWYKFLVPIADDYDTMTLEQILHKLYTKKLGFSTKHPENNPRITELDPKSYPILSDLLEVIEEEMYSNKTLKTKKETLSRLEFERLENLNKAIGTTIATSGILFNGYSSIRDFTNEQIIFFSIEGLKDGNKKAFNAQLYNAMNLFLDNLTAIGEPQKQKFEAKDSNMDMSDILKFKLYFDEAQQYVNASSPEIVMNIDSFNRESRKLFGGMVLATHTINGFFPKDSTKEGVDAMMNLFSLTQYKVLFCQPNDSIKTIAEVFGGELPIQDLNSLSKMGVGECVLNISGDTTVHFDIEVSEEEKVLFTGGA